MGYLEVHIEQGPQLETENLAVGVVTAINGVTRARVRVTGEAGHAGTVPDGHAPRCARRGRRDDRRGGAPRRARTRHGGYGRRRAGAAGRDQRHPAKVDFTIDAARRTTTSATAWSSTGIVAGMRGRGRTGGTSRFR
jgi:allantoate deiminase